MVLYWFAGKYPYVGLVVRRVVLNHEPLYSTYLYTAEIMENDGRLSTFDVHDGDRFEILCESVR